ncbi:MAG: 2-dehydropantoate 2-reductase [Bacteroidetes bacterium]|nr:2-dehydropantoate 2-reductase [Bacteroidota bacterium]
MTSPKILIAGTGALGGYFGGRLALNKNYKVYFLSRGNTLKLLKKKGLAVKSIHGDFKIKINVSDNLSSFRTKFDYVIMCVKSNDTLPLIPALKKVTTSKTIIISVQNGIYNFNILKKEFGKSRVMQTVSRIASEMKGNTVLHTALGIIVIGEENGKISIRIKAIHKLLSVPGIKCKISDYILHEIWVKLAWNTIFNTLTAIAFCTVEELFKDKKITGLIDDLYKEISKVAASAEIRFTKDDYKKVVTDTKTIGISKTSAYQDREKGRAAEVTYFTSELLKIAAANNIETPALKAIHLLANLI